MPDEEENLHATDRELAEGSLAATAAAGFGVEPDFVFHEEDGVADGEETLPLSPSAATGDRPPTRAEFDQLAAEVRRLAGQIAHGRS